MKKSQTCQVQRFMKNASFITKTWVEVHDQSGSADD